MMFRHLVQVSINHDPKLNNIAQARKFVSVANASRCRLDRVDSLGGKLI